MKLVLNTPFQVSKETIDILHSEGVDFDIADSVIYQIHAGEEQVANLEEKFGISLTNPQVGSEVSDDTIVEMPEDDAPPPHTTEG